MERIKPPSELDIDSLNLADVWKEWKEGKYKTWTPGPWTPSVDRVHGPGPSKYGPGPCTPLSWTGSMDPLFLQGEVAP